MGKLIDADALIRSLMVDPVECPGCPEPEFLSDLIEVFKTAPTVDAVPVVRCKDCRWRDDQSGSTAWMPCRALITPNDFYCPRGERKDGDA